MNPLRSFFGWLHRQDYADAHVLQNLKQPKTADLAINTLSRAEIDRKMRTINPKTALGIRNTVLAIIMLDTRFRISEAAGLEDQDVHVERQYLKAMGKGSEERVVSFGTAYQKTLFQYRQRFGGDLTDPSLKYLAGHGGLRQDCAPLEIMYYLEGWSDNRASARVLALKVS